ncbi:MAG: ribonuclease HII [Candidatus Doudnabacteria bacterium]|nr:ribonuclease HII [Candidatus Doudnabacteria bacterium]
MFFPTYKHEKQKLSQGFKIIAGSDEVGVGPLAGPVVAASVILDPESIGKRRSRNKWWYEVRDSKQLTEKQRAELVNFIKDNSLDWAVSRVEHETIDQINILQASLLAMEKSIERLKNFLPDFILVDGRNQVPHLSCPQEAIIDGDQKVLSISCASILAKVARDNLLNEFHKLYPRYGFDRHKGYPTKEHRAAIAKYGLCPIHRRSFLSVKQV